MLAVYVTVYIYRAQQLLTQHVCAYYSVCRV